MKRYESQTEDFEAWVEVPDEWLWGHYATYSSAYWQAVLINERERKDDAGVEPMTRAEAQVAGTLALILSGAVKVSIPGIEIDGDDMDLSEIDARAMGVLHRYVVVPLEATQHTNFSLVAPSGNGSSTAKDK